MIRTAALMTATTVATFTLAGMIGRRAETVRAVGCAEHLASRGTAPELIAHLCN